MDKIRQQYRTVWQQAYDRLNDNQQKAVNTIEGPVMVVAGPGTGKTDLLAVRIGNILMQTDVFPHNILCMTFTDAGVIAMRNRLEKYIGPDAYNVSIQTFHSFCNNVIRENLQFFGDFRDLQALTDLEKVEVFRELIDGFPDDHKLKRVKGEIYYDAGRLENLFKVMKQENWTGKYISDKYDDYMAMIMDPLRSPYIYKKKTTTDERTYEIGEIRMGLVNVDIEKYSKVVAASAELDNYNRILRSRERFDFQDMILWVLDKFKNNETLLARYQERYQYILVDEYQDTNGAQNELINLLASYWEKPNLFIVGDDDQSIFRFQGANMSSVLDFREMYQPEEIVLTHNYRSSQVILDAAGRLISNNADRLVARFRHLIKNLVEARTEKPEFSPEPVILRYANIAQEEADIARRIMELRASGVNLNDVAIIYTKHAAGANLIRYFMQKKIPVNVKNRINVLFEKDVERICNLLEYISSEYARPHSREDMCHELLHYDFLGVSPRDVAAISIFVNKGLKNDGSLERTKLCWRNVISSREALKIAEVNNPDSVLRVSEMIESWIGSVPNFTVQMILDKVLNESGLLNRMLADLDVTWKMQLLSTFYDFVKAETARAPGMSLKDLVNMVGLMKETRLELPVVRIISNKDGVNFLSAHGAKGLEFEHVFIIRCNPNMWESKKSGNSEFSMPPNIAKSTGENSDEDERRLFYVAMTRAKNFLYVSYPENDESEKLQQPSKFLAEMRKNTDQPPLITVNDMSVVMYKAELMKNMTGELQLIDKNMVDRLLEEFKVSVTSLNKYLKCRVAFYFETLLKVPGGRNKHTGFGSAMHYAMEQFFNDIKSSSPRSHGQVSKLTGFFEKGMDKYRSHFTEQEYDNYLKHGITSLQNYYNAYSDGWLRVPDYSIEYNISQTEYEGVPISGKLDRVNIFDGFVTVTDYKTGPPDTGKIKDFRNDKDGLGGEYWRQIMFYYLLLNGDKKHGWKMKEGIIDFLEEDNKTGKLKQFPIEVSEDGLNHVGNLVKDVYTQIKLHNFSPGCGEENCRWCNFVGRNMPATLPEADADTEESEFEVAFDPSV